MDEHGDQARAERHRRRFFVRAFIFLTLAAVAQASVALPPGPSKPAFYWASLAVLVACAPLVAPLLGAPSPLGHPHSHSGLSRVGHPLADLGRYQSERAEHGGGSCRGWSCCPSSAMALYYPRSYALIVIVAAMVGLTVAGVAVQSSDATDLRRLFLWTAVSAVVAVTIHHLRVSLESKVRDSTDLARLGRLMNGATQSLTSLRDPKEVITEGTKVMVDVVGTGSERRLVCEGERRRRHTGGGVRRSRITPDELPAERRPVCGRGLGDRHPAGGASCIVRRWDRRYAP